MKSQMYRDIVLWKLGREGVHFPVVEIIEDASIFGVESLKTLERISDLWECTYSFRIHHFLAFPIPSNQEENIILALMYNYIQTVCTDSMVNCREYGLKCHHTL
jgi:hypothetical protein